MTGPECKIRDIVRRDIKFQAVGQSDHYLSVLFYARDSGSDGVSVRWHPGGNEDPSNHFIAEAMVDQRFIYKKGLAFLAGHLTPKPPPAFQSRLVRSTFLHRNVLETEVASTIHESDPLFAFACYASGKG